MNKRLAIAALGGAGVLAAGVAMVPAALASSGSTSHTLHFIAVSQGQKQLNQTTFTEEDKDVQKGKTIGYDVLLFNATSANSSAGRVAFASKNGFLYGKLTVHFTSTTFHGTIIGGTGAYKGATGTLLGKNLNQAGSRSAITVKFTT